MAWLKRLITTQRLQKLKIKYQTFDLIKNTDFDKTNRGGKFLKYQQKKIVFY